jgi:hypothetical protein
MPSSKGTEPGAQDINITDALLPGFEFRIRPFGVRAFAFRYRIQGGPQRRLRLGNYPALSADLHAVGVCPLIHGLGELAHTMAALVVH